MRILSALLFVFLGCSEAPLIPNENNEDLNNPVSFVLIPGTQFGVLANANVTLTERTGSMVAVDLTARTILSNTLIRIPSFAGRMFVDTGRSQIYVADRGDDAALIYSYSIPGIGGLPISFSEVSVPSAQENTTNGVKTDDSPYDVVLSPGTISGDVLLLTSPVDGTLTTILASSLTPLDLDPDEKDFIGLPLISAANFQDKKKKPGRGANRIVPTADGKLFYITSTQSSNIYVIDAHRYNVEAMIDLSLYSALGDTRGIAIDSNGLAYIAHRGLQGILVLNVSGITENGIDMEVVDAPFVDYIPVGGGPEAAVLSTDQQRLFVSLGRENQVVTIDVPNRRVKTRTPISGSVPGDIILDSANGVYYVLDFLSSDILVFDEVTGALLETIE